MSVDRQYPHVAIEHLRLPDDLGGSVHWNVSEGTSGMMTAILDGEALRLWRAIIELPKRPKLPAIGGHIETQ